MAYRKKYVATTMSTQSSPIIPPAQLWFGSHEYLVTQATHFLQKVFCTNNGCTRCITCKQILEKQYHTIVWLYPEKSYTLEELSLIFSTISFALEPDQHFFFIIQKA